MYRRILISILLILGVSRFGILAIPICYMGYSIGTKIHLIIRDGQVQQDFMAWIRAVSSGSTIRLCPPSDGDASFNETLDALIGELGKTVGAVERFGMGIFAATMSPSDDTYLKNMRGKLDTYKPLIESKDRDLFSKHKLIQDIIGAPIDYDLDSIYGKLSPNNRSIIWKYLDKLLVSIDSRNI